MIVHHTGSDLEEGIHLLVFVAQCSRWIWAKARFVRINCDGITLVKSRKLVVNIITKVYLGNKA